MKPELLLIILKKTASKPAQRAEAGRLGPQHLRMDKQGVRPREQL